MWEFDYYNRDAARHAHSGQFQAQSRAAVGMAPQGVPYAVDRFGRPHANRYTTGDFVQDSVFYDVSDETVGVNTAELDLSATDENAERMALYNTELHGPPIVGATIVRHDETRINVDFTHPNRLRFFTSAPYSNRLRVNDVNNWTSKGRSALYQLEASFHLVPRLALGSMQSSTLVDFVYFTLPTPSGNYLYGVSYVAKFAVVKEEPKGFAPPTTQQRLINEAVQFLERSKGVTLVSKNAVGVGGAQGNPQEKRRQYTYVAICVISKVPFFSYIGSRLECIAQTYFHNKCFRDYQLLVSFVEQMNSAEMVENWSYESLYANLEMYFKPVALCLSYRSLLFIVKSLMVGRKITVYSQSAARTSTAVLAMLTMIPGASALGFNSNGFGSMWHSWKKFAMPLQLFHSQNMIFPYFTMEMVNLVKGVSGYIVGITDLKIIQCLDQLPDFLVNLEQNCIQLLNGGLLQMFHPSLYEIQHFDSAAEPEYDSEDDEIVKAVSSTGGAIYSTIGGYLSKTPSALVDISGSLKRTIGNRVSRRGVIKCNESALGLLDKYFPGTVPNWLKKCNTSKRSTVASKAQERYDDDEDPSAQPDTRVSASRPFSMHDMFAKMAKHKSHYHYFGYVEHIHVSHHDKERIREVEYAINYRINPMQEYLLKFLSDVAYVCGEKRMLHQLLMDFNFDVKALTDCAQTVTGTVLKRGDCFFRGDLPAISFLESSYKNFFPEQQCDCDIPCPGEGEHHEFCDYGDPVSYDNDFTVIHPHDKTYHQCSDNTKQCAADTAKTEKSSPADAALEFFKSLSFSKFAALFAPSKKKESAKSDGGKDAGKQPGSSGLDDRDKGRSKRSTDAVKDAKEAAKAATKDEKGSSDAGTASEPAKDGAAEASAAASDVQSANDSEKQPAADEPTEGEKDAVSGETAPEQKEEPESTAESAPKTDAEAPSESVVDSGTAASEAPASEEAEKVAEEHDAEKAPESEQTEPTAAQEATASAEDAAKAEQPDDSNTAEDAAEAETQDNSGPKDDGDAVENTGEDSSANAAKPAEPDANNGTADATNATETDAKSGSETVDTAAEGDSSGAKDAAAVKQDGGSPAENAAAATATAEKPSESAEAGSDGKEKSPEAAGEGAQKADEEKSESAKPGFFELVRQFITGEFVTDEADANAKNEDDVENNELWNDTHEYDTDSTPRYEPNATANDADGAEKPDEEVPRETKDIDFFAGAKASVAEKSNEVPAARQSVGVNEVQVAGPSPNVQNDELMKEMKKEGDSGECEKKGCQHAHEDEKDAGTSDVKQGKGGAKSAAPIRKSFTPKKKVYPTQRNYRRSEDEEIKFEVVGSVATKIMELQCNHGIDFIEMWVNSLCAQQFFEENELATFSEPVYFSKSSMAKQKYANGDVYIGDMKYMKRDGKGTYITADGTVYEGDWVGGKRHGEGSLISEKQGYKYRGQWVSDKRNGYGELQTPTFIYSGIFKNNTFHGTGKLVHAGGDTYEGDFENGQYCGRGKLISIDGTVKIGSFRNNELQGVCSMIKPDGRIYVGKLHGEVLHGPGKIIYDKLVSFEGQWDRGIRNGQGAVTIKMNDTEFSATISIEGTWVNDSLVMSDVLVKFPGGYKYVGTLAFCPDLNPLLRLPSYDESVFTEAEEVMSTFSNRILPHGGGIIKAPSGSTYSGDLLCGMRHGNGVMIFHNGVSYNGPWAYGTVHGVAEVTFPGDMPQKRLIFEYGQLLDELDKKQRQLVDECLMEVGRPTFEREFTLRNLEPFPGLLRRVPAVL
ncbi:MORN repeat protein, putative [Babesia bigemina]|uniref:MORN repeat protein, putative n=1 Tax=Babesia bigemina TaxID=5866 RepID=A0A061DD18_BABBI|nr:MORN repeat protein, putative [Babesia bigemina]CDR95870.1 MORN repeat protein, putative [Babesia bigemina]|eukprot:XP_012768056.1 MORN repeat protein, putative [Babesia bigemina]